MDATLGKGADIVTVLDRGFDAAEDMDLGVLGVFGFSLESGVCSGGARILAAKAWK